MKTPSRGQQNIVTYQFATDTAAWAFMRACDEAGIQVGFPSLTTPPSVQAGIPNTETAARADRLAESVAT